MGIDVEHLTRALIESVLFSGVGLLAFVVAFYAVERMVPFSLRKEIEEDQNIAVGIMLGSLAIAIAIIIAAAIGG